jgi:5-methylcytosine-specific restriction endonuclease McrA
VTWLKISDEFLEDTTVLTLKDRAYRLHVSAMVYSSRNLTDGVVTEKQMKVIQAILGYQVKRFVEELIDAGLWRVRPDGAYAIKNFLKYNPKAADVKAQRERNAERQARYRSRHGKQDEQLDYAAIAQRDDHTCYLCGEAVGSKDWSFDHVIPLGQGGEHSAENVRLTHLRCNKRKGGRSLNEVVAMFPRMAVDNRVSDTVSNGVTNAAPTRPDPKEHKPRAVTNYQPTAQDHESTKTTINQSLKEAS